MNVLVFNPGGNSLKAEIVSCDVRQQYAFESTMRVSVIVEGIGKEPKLARFRGKEQEPGEAIQAESYAQAAESILRWFEEHAGSDIPHPNEVDCVGLRVVHGGERFSAPTVITPQVEQQIRDLEKLAPLHNKSAVELIGPLQRAFERVSAHAVPINAVPIYAVFDTAFHRTIPEHVRLYAIPLELSKKHAIRKYGFHGISHRYMMERYAYLAGKQPHELNLVTMHLESGCSVTAIAGGRSVDNSMGLTPLQGLMMGTRSGDVDPALVEFLMREEHMDVDAVMTLLNKKSGLLGVSGKSLDTRVLMPEYDRDARVHLAIEMFSYRVRTTVGAYLAALGGADAVIFGGGIAENTPLVRQRVCEGLRWCGLEMDEAQNQKLINIEGRLSTEHSRLQAFVIPVEEGLQIAHECAQAQAAVESAALVPNASPEY
jgi:acetate kinase